MRDQSIPSQEGHCTGRRFGVFGAALLLLATMGCASRPIEDPAGELANSSAWHGRHLAAMAMLDEIGYDELATEALHGAIWRPGYRLDVREAALIRLVEHDRDGLKRTIRQRLPNMTNWPWLTRLCEIIAEREWIELTPALVSSWSRPTTLVATEAERPEYQALSAMHGEHAIVDAVLDLFLDSNTVALQGLRRRCWNLLVRIGERRRLVELITRAEVPEDDAMLLDLQAAAMHLGILPTVHEEVLWLRKLREPERAAFWSEAGQVLSSLSIERRSKVELRDLAILVAAARHKPAMLRKSSEELYRELDEALRSQRHHRRGSYYNDVRSGQSDRLQGSRASLSWGDLAAMHMAVRAFEAPGMIEHLFHYAERDRADESTEYGGIVQLDENGRFELLEFPPRIRHHDRKFIAPQAMFDAGYTALFHFHFHVQKSRNAEYAGPGAGDMNYAENTRANCLVFTSINSETLNMDFYRHGGIVVDLGEIRRR